MIEIAAAALVPALALFAISRAQRDVAFRRAVERTFIPLTLLWFAPCWLTGRSPAPLTYLFAQMVPWNQLGIVERWVAPIFVVHNTLLSDVVLQFLPWREVVTEAWLHGHLPLLNRFAGAGSPVWANPQAAVLAPTTILGLPFSTFAWPLFAAVVKVLTALTGMYLFLRAEGRTDAAARFGAIAYGFCAFGFAFMLFPLTNVTTLLPWMLLAIRRAAEERWSGVVFAAIVTLLLLLGGHPESVLHAAFIAVPYGFVRAGGRRGVAMLGWAALIGLLIGAPVVVPFLRLVPLTERAARDASFFKAPALSPTNLLPFVFPAHFEYSANRTGANFNETATQYAGFATFILAVFAAIMDARRQRFWIVMFAILTIFAFDLIPFGVPVLHGRIRFVLAFITVVVAAAGFDFPSDRSPLLRVISTAAVLVVIGVTAAFWSYYVRIGIAAIVLASAATAVISALLLSLNGQRRVLWLALFADLAILGMTSHPPTSRSLAYPSTPVIDFLRRIPQPYRFVGLEGALFPNTSAMFGLEDIRVHDPVAFEPYALELERAGYDRRLYFEVFRTLPAHALADRLGVRYIVAAPDARGALPVVYRGDDAVVFLNRTAMPPFSIDGPGKLDLLRHEAAEAKMRVMSPVPGSVRTGVAALPGWELLRNGKPWPLTSQRALLGWSIPPGRSDFVLRYRPAGLMMGLGFSVIGITLLLHAAWRSATNRSSSSAATAS
jgi:hypothetical protein